MNLARFLAAREIQIYFYFKEFLDVKFSGVDPEDIIFLMTLPEPENSISNSAVKEVEKQEQIPIQGKLGYCLMLKEGTECPEELNLDPDEIFEASERKNLNGASISATYFSEELSDDKLSLIGYFSLPTDLDGSIPIK